MIAVSVGLLPEAIENALNLPFSWTGLQQESEVKKERLTKGGCQKLIADRHSIIGIRSVNNQRLSRITDWRGLTG